MVYYTFFCILLTRATLDVAITSKEMYQGKKQDLADYLRTFLFENWQKKHTSSQNTVKTAALVPLFTTETPEHILLPRASTSAPD